VEIRAGDQEIDARLDLGLLVRVDDALRLVFLFGAQAFLFPGLAVVDVVGLVATEETIAFRPGAFLG
jgi:hypothetical protein